ncbi:MAG: amidohydrolase [Clostridia bacterium]|nr:amidohydrolase [Clostridia bacterium]MBQ7969352.1 amidohydrolase [Clostridia bacterium]
MIKNKYYVIDAHCHIYPEKIAARAVQGTDNFYKAYNDHSYGTGTINNLLEVGDGAGIDHYIVQSVATTPHQVGRINEFIAESVANGNGRFTGLGTLHPDSPDILSDFNHLLSLGLKGVKLHPDIQQFKIDDYRCLRIYELCEQEGLPILMHTGDHRYDFSNPNRLFPVMDIYTGLTVVGAHFGGWSIWEEAADKLAQLPNLYVDCSSSLYYVSSESAKKIIHTYGVDKVLFGTDYPMWDPKLELERFFNIGLTEEENKKIFSENAKKIFMK